MAVLNTQRIMAQGQMRFKQAFIAQMKDVTAQMAGIILRYAQGDQIIEGAADVLVNQLRGILDREFIQTGGSQALRPDGTPLSPYARLLMAEIARVTDEVVGLHNRYLEAVAPADVLAWMRRPDARVSEMDAELEALKREYADLRLFAPNPLAEYEPAHTWVDPNGYKLSERIWRADVRMRGQVDGLIRDLIAQGVGATEMARQLEQFLTPGRAKLRTLRPYGQDASYDAMRIARTEIARAANQAALISATLNPYVNAIDVVRSANGDPTCPICPRHATIGIGGGRLRAPYSVYAANIGPYHPHCMCRVQSVLADNPGAVTERLRRMVQDSARVNLPPAINPAQRGNFTRFLLGDAIYQLLLQVVL